MLDKIFEIKVEMDDNIVEVYDCCMLIYVNFFDDFWILIVICVIEWFIGKIMILCMVCCFEC